jgi:hypothetical protein
MEFKDLFILLFIFIPWKVKGTWTIILVTLFKNSDDPIPIVAKKELWTDKPMWQRKLLWWIRNPFPDFVSYVIGIRGLSFTSKTFSIGMNWWFSIRFLDAFKWIPFPYLKYENEKGTMFYIGWRSNGAFGLALKIA